MAHDARKVGMTLSYHYSQIALNTVLERTPSMVYAAS